MLSQKITEMRNKAHEANAANKIMDMLDKLRKSNNELSKRRWIWELIQNAKDAVNSSGKIDISIIFDEANGIVEFKHNGKLFTTENLVFLIEQVSSKDRTDNSNEQRKTTGKFGTGFLTTHLLSGKVVVSGYLQDSGETPRKFCVELDRTGRDKQAIISAITASCKQLDESSTFVSEADIDENAYNTTFVYQLNSDGIETAREGIQNLITTVPYVLAFVPEINSVVINDGQFAFRRRTEPSIALDNAYVLEVHQEKGDTSAIRHICVTSDVDVSVAVEIGRSNNRKFICEFSSLLPRLFCDFPLIGTEDFAFPVVVNSSQFNPNEPRDGVWLNDNDDDTDILENKRILEKAVALYKNLLKYLNDNSYECIYNITSIKSPVRKDWLSSDWLSNNILGELKPFIEKEEIIPTHNGARISILDKWDDSNIYLMKDLSKELRKKTWQLVSCIYPNKITKSDEIESWYGSLWSDCRNFGLEDLIYMVSDNYDIESLSEKLLDSVDVFDWLNQLYAIIFANKSLFMDLKQENIKLFPNQNEVLCCLDNLYIDESIDDVHKDLAKMIEVNVTSWLAHVKIANSVSAYIGKYKLEDLAKEMSDRYNDFEYGNEEFCLRLLCLRIEEEQYLTDEHKELCEFINKLYPESMDKVYIVSRYIPKLLNESLSYWREKILNDISSCDNLFNFSNRFNVENVVDFINQFISFLNKYKHSNRLNDNCVTIFPNQNDVFVTKEALFIDDEGVDEILKDICKHMDYDIRNHLLHSDIYLELPTERNFGIGNIADKIIKFVEENANKYIDEADLRDDFNRLLRWIRDSTNAKLVNRHFSRLKKNIHWFYNDDDIASNMEKADRYESLLTRFGVKDENGLEELLKKVQQIEDSEKEESIEITQNLLAQYGIATEKGLKDAIERGVFGESFVHTSGQFDGYFDYVQGILERSKNNVLKHLREHKDYDLSDIDEIAPTVFVVKKHDEEIYLIVRPSDGEQVIIYYQSEFDILDYERDWELWVENGIDEPEKLTFGKILKRTGMNKIPLKKVL